MDIYDYLADLTVLEDDDSAPCDSNCHCTAAHEIDLPYEDSDDEDVPTAIESVEEILDCNPIAEDVSGMDEEDSERLTGEPIQRTRTRALKARLAGEDVATKVANILTCINNEGMDLPLFLDALFWGHPDCHTARGAKYRFARTSLLVSEELPGILERWYRPPLTRNKGRRPAGARPILDEFAVRITNSLINKEMEHIAPHFYSDPQDLSKEHLTSFDFAAFATTISVEAPLVWKIFDRILCRDAQRQRNVQKNLAMVSLVPLITTPVACTTCWLCLTIVAVGHPLHGVTGAVLPIVAPWPTQQDMGALPQSLWTLCSCFRSTTFAGNCDEPQVGSQCLRGLVRSCHERGPRGYSEVTMGYHTRQCQYPNACFLSALA